MFLTRQGGERYKQGAEVLCLIIHKHVENVCARHFQEIGTLVRYLKAEFKGLNWGIHQEIPALLFIDGLAWTERVNISIRG